MQTFDDWSGTLRGIQEEALLNSWEMLDYLIDAIPVAARGEVYRYLVDNLDLERR